MSPVLQEINVQVIQPYLNEKITSKQAFHRVQQPLHGFMLEQTRIKDMNMFMEIADVDVEEPEGLPIHVLIPHLLPVN